MRKFDPVVFGDKDVTDRLTVFWDEEEGTTIMVECREGDGSLGEYELYSCMSEEDLRNWIKAFETALAMRVEHGK